MTSRRLLVISLYVAVMAGYFTFLLIRYSKRLSVRRRLIREGRVTAAQTRAPVQSWLRVIVVLAAFAPAYWFGETDLAARWGVGIARCAVFGFLFVVTFAFLTVRGMLAQDAVVVAARRFAGVGELERGAETLRAAMDIQPTAPRAATLGELLLAQERCSEAAEAYAVAQRLEPEVPAHAIRRAMALVQGGDVAGALGVVEVERVARPQEAALAWANGYVLALLGRDSEALEQHRQAVELEQAAGEAQRTDYWLRREVRKLCEEKMRPVSTERGFPVVTLTPGPPTRPVPVSPTPPNPSGPSQSPSAPPPGLPPPGLRGDR
jgi:tetratricopeptide (TPR) repeat protein